MGLRKPDTIAQKATNPIPEELSQKEYQPGVTHFGQNQSALMQEACFMRQP